MGQNVLGPRPTVLGWPIVDQGVRVVVSWFAGLRFEGSRGLGLEGS